MAVSTRTPSGSRPRSTTFPQAQTGPTASNPSKTPALFYALKGYFVFWGLKIKHRYLLHEIRSFASHLVERIFPALRETQQQWLTLEPARDCANSEVCGRCDEKRFSFPGTVRLAREMQRLALDRIELDTSLEYFQLIETILILSYVSMPSNEGDTGTKPYAGWNRRKIASRMASQQGFRRFCTLMRLQPEDRTYTVEYSYCEPQFSAMVRRYVGRRQQYRGSRELFRAAPKLVFLGFVVCTLPLFFLHVHTAAAVVAWLLMSALIAAALGLGLHTLGSMQLTQEHHVSLIQEYIEQITILSRFPESNPNPQLKLNLDGEVLYCNRAAQRLLPELDLGPDEAAKILPANYKDLLSECLDTKDTLHEAEASVGGKVFSFRFSAFPGARSFIASGSDVTYLRKIESDLRDINQNLEGSVEERTEELHLTRDVIVLSLAGLAEMRDPETGKHLERTRRFARMLAEQLEDRRDFAEDLDSESIHWIYMSAPLHDIGKVGIRDSILLKPGKLSAAEFDEMKRHAALGGDVLKKAAEGLGFDSFLDMARDIAYSHHEKWDGTGYPKGLKGNTIAWPARVMALADVYDALTSKRPYKEPWPHERARDLILEERGKHFDPAIVDAFSQLEDKFRDVALALCDTEV